MFRGLINDAKAAAGALVGKYLVRASVAVPFLVAFGFAVAAITLVLVNRYGAISAYLMLAGAFTLVGLVAALAVAVKEQEDEVAEAQAERSDTASVATDAAAQAAVQTPLALLGALMATPVGPAAIANGAKLALRNIPVVVLLVLIGMLFWPGEPAAETEDRDSAVPRRGQPNGAHPPSADVLHHEAA